MQDGVEKLCWRNIRNPLIANRPISFLSGLENDFLLRTGRQRFRLGGGKDQGTRGDGARVPKLGHRRGRPRLRSGNGNSGGGKSRAMAQ